jgi:XTP/dITP diphosphohydrolase
MNKTLVVASGNAGKVREFTQMLAPLGYDVLSLQDFNDVPEVVEDGETFQANARKKAQSYGDALGMRVLADDSGLEVALLGGAPGVYSARYAGEPTNDEANNQKLIRDLNEKWINGDFAALAPAELKILEMATAQGKQQHCIGILSLARYVCHLTFYNPADKSVVEATGEAHGAIIRYPKGTGGFGYDPYFWVASKQRTMAELTPAEKHAISHRGAALRSLVDKLRQHD